MRREFPKSVKRDAADRCAGKCEACSIRLPSGGFHYDHELPDWMGGEPTLENCKVLCIKCHREKTSKQDVPSIAKAKRIQDRERGIFSPKKSWGYGRNDRFKMKIGGILVDRKSGERTGGRNGR